MAHPNVYIVRINLILYFLLALITEVKLSGLAKMGVAKRRRRDADIAYKSGEILRQIRQKRAILNSPTGGRVDTASTDAEMVTFLTNNGATKVVINWTE